MTDATQTPAQTPIDPDKIIFTGAMTARDCLVQACRNNMGLLAQAAVVKDDQTFTLNVNMSLAFRAADVRAILADAGFVVERAPEQQPAANDEGKTP